MFEMLEMILMMTLTLMIRTMMLTKGGDGGDDNDNDDKDDDCGDGYYIHQSVSAVHSAGEALSSLSGHNVDKLKQ